MPSKFFAFYCILKWIRFPCIKLLLNVNTSGFRRIGWDVVWPKPYLATDGHICWNPKGYVWIATCQNISTKNYWKSSLTSMDTHRAEPCQACGPTTQDLTCFIYTCHWWLWSQIPMLQGTNYEISKDWTSSKYMELPFIVTQQEGYDKVILFKQSSLFMTDSGKKFISGVSQLHNQGNLSSCPS